ncbi:MAG TPA: MarR family transcriptional regulator [Marmoricola sp.]|jgi:DNA-binding transcriptional regulator GbsR (MarR family)|nr:MarR family transcriptional regulator [Marmoricola sp.]
MPEDAKRTEFVERLGGSLTQMGFPRMPARVFAALLAAPEETLTARELSGRLGVSAAAISGAVRYLEQFRMVERTRVPGDRVDRFGVGVNFWEHAIRAEAAAFRPLVEMFDAALDGIDFGAAKPRVQETRDFLSFYEAEVPRLLARWRATRERG